MENLKNFYSYKEFVNEKKSNQYVNEGLIGLIKKAYNSIKNYANKIKGSKEIDAEYNKIVAEFDKLFVTQTATAGAKTAAATGVKAGTETKTESMEYLFEADATAVATTDAKTDAKAEKPISAAPEQNVKTPEQNEEEAATKLTPEALKKKQAAIDARFPVLKNQLFKNIDAVIARLTENGKKPNNKLTKYADTMKAKFLAYLFDKEIEMYNQSGDKNKVAELTKKRTEVDQNLQKTIKELQASVEKTNIEKEIYDPKAGEKYKYNSQSLGKEINIEVLNKKDDKTVHVKNLDGDAEFDIAINALKK